MKKTTKQTGLRLIFALVLYLLTLLFLFFYKWSIFMLKNKTILSKILNAASALALLGTVMTSASWAMDSDKSFCDLPEEITRQIIPLMKPEKPIKSVTFLIEDKESYEYALNPTHVFTPSLLLVSKSWNTIFKDFFPFQIVNLTLTHNFLNKHCLQFDPQMVGSEQMNFLKQLYPSLSKLTKATACKSLATRHSNMNALTLLDEVCHDPSDPNMSFPVDFGNDKAMLVAGHPLTLFLQNPLPQLTSLTVYNGQLGNEEILNNLLELPSLTHLSVSAYKDGRDTFKAGTQNQFSKCWEILSPKLKRFEWHHALVSDQTATSISNYLKNSTTVLFLDLTNAQTSEESKTKINAAIALNNFLTANSEKIGQKEAEE
jgi:hypothetical protein